MTLASEAPATGAPAGRSAGAATILLGGANVLRLGAQLALLPVLARLVGPADYGLVALAMPFILLCNVMADGGLGPALARRQAPTPALESTVFWLAGGIGAALALSAAAVAWPIGLALGEARLPMLILALAPILALSGATAAANARVIRERRFTVFAVGDVVSTFAGGAAALAAALNGWGAWSLVAQQLVLWTCKAAWVVTASRLPIRLHCRPSEARELFAVGGHNIGATLGDFAARNLDNVIVGGVLGSLSLGYYAMAYQIIRVPDLVISGPLYLLIFSSVARATGGAGPQPAAIGLSALRLAAIGLAPVFTGLALTAGTAVALVLGPNWAPATGVLAWLCAAGFGFSINSVAAAALMGLGRSELQFRLALASAALTVAAVTATARFGVEVAGAAVAATTLVMSAAYLATLARVLRIAVARIAAALAPAAVGAGAMTITLILLREPLAGLSDLARLAAFALAGAAAYATAAGLMARRTLPADLRIFRN